jgi:hypothetical protein
MKIGSQLQFEIPDHCPENCEFIEEKKFFSMTSFCFRCPIINCTSFDGPPDENGKSEPMCLVNPEDFGEDWAKEWEEFFKGGPIPEMRFEITEK